MQTWRLTIWYFNMPENWNYPNNCCRRSCLHILHKMCGLQCMWKRRLKALHKLTFIMIQQAWKFRRPFTLNFNNMCEIGYGIHGNIHLQHIHSWLYYESHGSELSKIIWWLQQTMWNYLWEQRKLHLWLCVNYALLKTSAVENAELPDNFSTKSQKCCKGPIWA